MMTTLLQLVLLAHVAATLMMVGLIWFVQIVHYPQFARVGREGFAAYQAEHMRATTWVVAVPMLVEAITAGLLAWRPPTPELRSACWVGLALVVVIWISTATLQVPRHNALALGFDAEAHRALVQSNWIRTLAWTARGVLVLYLVSQVATAGRP